MARAGPSDRTLHRVIGGIQFEVNVLAILVLSKLLRLLMLNSVARADCGARAFRWLEAIRCPTKRASMVWGASAMHDCEASSFANYYNIVSFMCNRTLQRGKGGVALGTLPIAVMQQRSASATRKHNMTINESFRLI